MRINRIRVTQIGSGVIAGIAVTASYGGQVALMEHWGVPAPYCYLIPLTVDVLALLANIARHTPELDRSGRVAGTVVLGMAGSVSIVANLLHGTNWGARIAYVWCVIAYLAAEYLVAKVTSAAGRTVVAPAAGPVVVPNTVPDMATLPEAPQSPAPVRVPSAPAAVEDPRTLAFREALRRPRTRTA